MFLKTIPILIIIAILLGGCSESTDVDKTYDRFVYFTVDNSANTDKSGLYKYSIVTSSFIRLHAESYHYISRITQDRKFIFEKHFFDGGQIAENERYMKMMDGSVITPNKPPQPENGWDVEMTPLPRAATAYNGRYLLFGGIALNPDEAPQQKPFLLLFDMAETSYDFVPLYEFIKDNEEQLKATNATTAGDFFGLTQDGSAIYFILKTLDENPGWALCSYKSDSLRMEMGPFDEPLSIAGFDSYSGNVILKMNDTIRTYSNGEISYNPLDKEHFYSPNQIVPSRSEMVIATDWGIELVYPSQGSTIDRVISYDEIDPDGEYSHEGMQCVISPDAQFIAFIMHKKEYAEGLYDLFIIARDGTEMTKVAENQSVTSMAISLPYEIDTSD
jgi:hypothetical protein